MEVTAAMVNQLHEEGYGFMEARNALYRANGDVDMARELLTMSKLDMAARLVMLEKRIKELERIVTILRP